MDLSQEIVRHGTDAIIEIIQDLHETTPDNRQYEWRIQEKLSIKLQNEGNFSTKIEERYNRILEIRGVTKEFTSKIGRCRADIVLYKNEKPEAIIELKILDERHKNSNILRDKNKMLVLRDLCGIECYLAVFVTDTQEEGFRERVRCLSSELNCKFHEGSPQRSRDDKWDWCFISGKVP